MRRLTLRDLKDVYMSRTLRIAVSTDYNKGYTWKEVLELPDTDTLWDGEVYTFTKTDNFDVVIKVRV